MTVPKSAAPAVDRADAILRLLATRTDPVRPAELAQHTGLAKSTLYLLLDSLEQRRWIEKKGSGYVVGIGLYVLGCAYIHHDGLQVNGLRPGSRNAVRPWLACALSRRPLTAFAHHAGS